MKDALMAFGGLLLGYIAGTVGFYVGVSKSKITEPESKLYARSAFYATLFVIVSICIMLCVQWAFSN